MIVAGISKITTPHFFGENNIPRIVLCVLSVLAVAATLTLYFNNLNCWKFVAIGAAGCEGIAFTALFFTPKVDVWKFENPFTGKELPHEGNFLVTLPKLSDFPFTADEISMLTDMTHLQDQELQIEIPDFNHLLQNPALEPLVKAYKQTKEHNLLMALHVFLKIKPVLVFEKITPEIREIIVYVVQAIDDKEIRFFEEGGLHFLVHQGELEKMRTFFLPPHLNTSLATIFNHQEEALPTQILSYYLGFGPSWESYATGTSKRKCPARLFSDEHYRQLGNVLLKAKPDCGVEAIMLGKMYSSLFPYLRKKAFVNETDWKEKFQKLGILQCVDGIAARTEYFRRLYTMKKRVAEFFKL